MSKLLAFLSLLVGLPAAGCSTSPAVVLLSETTEVRIRLTVSGGIAGVDFTLLVDGAEGVVRLEGGTYRDHRQGDAFVGLSATQIAHLSNLLVEAGVREHRDRDFGIECCDQFHYDLTYTDPAGEHHMWGSSERFPRALREAVGAVHRLAQGVRAVHVDADADPDDWPSDPFDLGTTRVDGDHLTLTVSYSGGCRAHAFDGVAWGGWIGSGPAHVNVLVAHDARGDACEAYPTVGVVFDLTPLRRAWEREFGTAPPGETTLILRIPDPRVANPQGVRFLEYRF